MSNSKMETIKPEAMKPHIWLQTVDGSIQQVEEEVAMFCPMICREILQTGMGSSKNYAISLPEQVHPTILSLIFDYCRFHQVPGRSDKERKSFDENFIRTDVNELCELTSAADSLQLRPLVDLTSRAIARLMEGKTPEEIRETFHIPDDLTEEEKLEPLKNISNDPQIRLLNRLYAKKRKELKERQKLKDMEVQGEREKRADERSLEDLLSFINGRDGDSKCVRPSKHKKKNRRRNDQRKVASHSDLHKTSNKGATNHCTVHKETGGTFPRNPSRSSEMGGSMKDAIADKFEFEDGFIDDDLDPAIKEELDREVEDFARRLNSDWLSLGERRLVPNIMNGNVPSGDTQGPV